MPDKEFGPWNPGIESQVPKELCHLATIFRPENVFTGVAAAAELRLQNVRGSLRLHKDERHHDIRLVEDLRHRVGLVRPGRLHVQLTDLGGNLVRQRIAALASRKR